MARWRPPLPKSSPYITPEGYAALEAELKALWEKRKEVTLALSAAAAEGDRSENAEYIYRKKELRGLDRRIHYLQNRLPHLNIICETPENKEKVFFGAWVTLENEAGGVVTYRIVGPDELDPKKNYISLDSPMAKTLLRKDLDDEIIIRIGPNNNKFVIIDIRYSDEADA